ncbi:MAG: hypothetical protein ABW328_14790 [Ilumatobacteraceae bacterium]
MQRRLFGLLAIPMVMISQCAPQSCAPTPAAGGLRPGTTISMGPIQSYGFAGHLGADWLGAGDRQICTPGCGYWALRNWNPAGEVDGNGVPVEPSGVQMGRVELYPDLIPGNWGSYDPWSPAMTVGGLHFWNPDGRAVNHLVLPHASNGAVRYYGTVTAGGQPIADGRMRMHAFQLVNKDTSAGAFNISTSRGAQWTAGWIWPGTYELFFFDDATGRSYYLRATLDPNAPLNLDLNQPCFGLSGVAMDGCDAT